MFNIKWIGIIKDEDIKKYQKGELNSNVIKINMHKSIIIYIGNYFYNFITQ